MAGPTAFDVIRAVSFLSRYHDLYTNNRKSPAPTSWPTTRIGAKLRAADLPGSHGEQTRIFRAFQQLYKEYDR